MNDVIQPTTHRLLELTLTGILPFLNNVDVAKYCECVHPVNGFICGFGLWVKHQKDRGITKNIFPGKITSLRDDKKNQAFFDWYLMIDWSSIEESIFDVTGVTTNGAEGTFLNRLNKTTLLKIKQKFESRGTNEKNA